jgi:DNA-binding NtrC family response regulator
MYQTIASGGFRSPLRAIREVTTQEGRPLQRYALKVEQALPPEPVVLITAALRQARGHRQEAARLLGWGRNTLTRKMRALDLDS